MIKPYYQDDYVTLYNGDCRDIMTEIDGTVDLVVTDPPYGLKKANGSHKGGYDGFGRKIKRNPKQYDGSWDNERPSGKTLNMLIDKAFQSIIWGGNYFSDLLPRSTRWLVWDKQQTMPTFSDCELAWINLKGSATKRIIYASNGMISGEKKRMHPTQKPLAVIKWCISQAPRDIKIILDPFAGSGTTGVAAKELNKKCIMIEKEEKYCEIAARRLSQEVFNFETEVLP